MFPVGCATASAWASARQQHVEPPLSVKLYRACVLLYRVPRYLGSLVARQLYNNVNEFIQLLACTVWKELGGGPANRHSGLW